MKKGPNRVTYLKAHMELRHAGCMLIIMSPRVTSPLFQVASFIEFQNDLQKLQAYR